MTKLEIIPGIEIRLDDCDVERVRAMEWKVKNFHAVSGGQSIYFVLRDPKELPLTHFILGCGRRNRITRKNGDPLDLTRDNLVIGKKRKKLEALAKPKIDEATMITRKSYAEKLLLDCARHLVPKANALISETVTPELAAWMTIESISQRAWPILLRRRSLSGRVGAET